jgi:hypothetical protein
MTGRDAHSLLTAWPEDEEALIEERGGDDLIHVSPFGEEGY